MSSFGRARNAGVLDLRFAGPPDDEVAFARKSTESESDNDIPHTRSLSCRANRAGDFRPVYVLQPKSP